MQKTNLLPNLENNAIPDNINEISGNTEGKKNSVHIKNTGLKCLAFVCFLLTVLFAISNLQAQQLFSVGKTELSQAQQDTLKELTKDRIVPASPQTVPFDISLQQITDDSVLIFKNEYNGATVVLSDLAQDVSKVTITPILIAELKNSVLGEGVDFTCNLVSGLEESSINLIEAIDFTLSETVELPTFEYFDEGTVKQTTVTDRKLAGISVVRPNLIPGNNDPETLKAAQKEAERYATYAYLYELPNGDLTTWVGMDPFVSSSDLEIESASVSTTTVGVSGGVPFKLITENLSSTEQACVERAMKYLSEKIPGSVPVRVVMGFSSNFSSPSVLGGSSTLQGYQLSGSTALYPSSLYNNIVGGQVKSGGTKTGYSYDIYIRFNTDWRNKFYYGVQRTSCPSDEYDFFSTVAHEVIHGLGFSSNIYYSNGSYLFSKPSIYDTFLSYNGIKLVDRTQSFRARAIVSENLVWTGNNVKSKLGRQAKLYAPSSYNSGSSVLHWDDSETFTTLMHWTLSAGKVNYFGDVDAALLLDIGWSGSEGKTTEVTQNGIKYVLNLSAHTAAIVGYTSAISSNVTIPEKVSYNNGQYSVTVIRATDSTGAFEDCITLKSIEIPASVTSVEDYAFVNCCNLEKVLFLGNKPTAGVGIFGGNTSKLSCVYFISGKNGWTNDGTWRGKATKAVASKPVITDQPKSQTVSEGASVTFSVSATGSDLKYQWNKDGKAINGATVSGYTITGAKISDAGNYTVTVSNDGGSVTSNEAILKVIAKPEIHGEILDGGLLLTFDGTLEVSEDGINWTAIDSVSPYTVKMTGTKKFFRSVK